MPSVIIKQRSPMRNCIWTLRTLIFAVFLLANTSVSAGPLARYGVFVYSNLCVEDQSGDMAGNRITIHRFLEGDSVLYEYSNGGLSLPVLADDVKIDKSVKLVTFRVAMPGRGSESITAELSEKGRLLILRGDWCGHVQAKIPLRLVNDFSRGIDRCAPCPG
jgi:hypothetical protein